MIRSWVVGVVAALSIFAAPALAQLPQVDIYFVRTHPDSADGAVVDTVIDLTQRAGYDNQPFFDGTRLFYTSVKDSGQAEIWSGAFDPGTPGFSPHPLTTTPESEYSPTLMPDGRALSVVRVEADSSQRLVRVGLHGEPPVRLLTEFPDLGKIGYHAWIDSTRVALFILGEPNELWIADTKTREKWRVAGDIGRCLRLVPWEKNPTICYTRTDGDAAFLEQVDVVTRQTTRLTPLPGKEVQDDAIIADPGHESGRRQFLCTQGSRVLSAKWLDKWDAWSAWEPWIDLAPFGLSGLTRIQVVRAGAAGMVVGLLVVAADQKPSGQ